MNNHTANHYPEMSILLITDDLSGLDNLQKFLFDCEIRLLVADSSARGMMMFEEELPALVLICKTARIDPFIITTRLRENWGYSANVVIVGSDDSVADWKRASETGALACLPNPDDTDEISRILQRVQNWMKTGKDSMQQLLNALKTTQLIDALPWGVILFGYGEKIIFANHTAGRLTGIARDSSGQQLDDLFLLLYGINSDAELLDIRNSINMNSPWSKTLYCGQNNLTLRLELLPLTAGSNSTASYHLITVQDIGAFPTSLPYQTSLSAAAFDLLFFRHYNGNEKSELATAILEGNLPKEETFRLSTLNNRVRQRLNASASIQEQQIPDYLDNLYIGHYRILEEILSALYRWALDSKGVTAVSPAVSLQGHDGNSICLRFSVTAVDRRLTRSSYQRGDEAVASQVASSGIPAFRTLRGIGLATILTSAVGTGLVLKTVAREGKTALFDIWLKQADESAVETPPVSRQKAHAETAAPVQTWDFSAEKLSPKGVLRILVAEDNPLEQLNIKGLMERLGHQVVMVGNGREAVEECEHNSFDLILMDILMPVMDGFEAVRLIREHERLMGGHTPVIALTSYSLKAVQERCLKSGMNGYLPKPVTQAKMEELVNTYFRMVPTADMAATDEKADAGETPISHEQYSSQSLPVLDIDEAITNLGSDISFFREMLNLFIAHGYPLLEEIVTSLQEPEVTADKLEKDAHKLKGMASNIGATQLQDICMRLQEDTGLDTPAVRNRYFQETSMAKNNLMTALEKIDWQLLKEKYNQTQ